MNDIQNIAKGQVAQLRFDERNYAVESTLDHLVKD